MNRQNDNGDTPLHIAQNNINLFHTLLELGADPNVKADDGGTPLHVNVYNQNNIKALLEGGADPNIKDNNGKTPLLSAVEYLYAMSTTVEYATTTADIDKLFIEWGAIPTLVDNYGNAPIHYLVVQEAWNKFIGARLGLDMLSKKLPHEIVNRILRYVYEYQERERDEMARARLEREREREQLVRKRARHIVSSK